MRTFKLYMMRSESLCYKYSLLFDVLISLSTEKSFREDTRKHLWDRRRPLNHCYRLILHPKLILISI